MDVPLSKCRWPQQWRNKNNFTCRRKTPQNVQLFFRPIIFTISSIVHPYRSLYETILSGSPYCKMGKRRKVRQINITIKIKEHCQQQVQSYPERLLDEIVAWKTDNMNVEEMTINQLTWTSFLLTVSSESSRYPVIPSSTDKRKRSKP